MSLEPSEAQIILDALDARLLTLHTSCIGEVVTYDPATQCANVKLVVNQPLELSDGTVLQEELPILPNVPVKWPRAGGYALHFPLAPGDTVEVTFEEASFALWRTTGQVGDVGDRRRFSLSHATATPCLAPDANPINPLDTPVLPPEAVLNGPGTIRFGSKPSATFVALAVLVDARFAAIVAWLNAHVHPTGVGPSGASAPPIAGQASVAAVKVKCE
jgi:hypothetical protein